MKTFLKRGALAGLVGGLASALVLLLLGERTISRAIELERQRAAASGEVIDEVFSRHVQLAGGFLGMAFTGVAFGVLFTVVYVAIRHRLAGRDEWQRVTRLAAVAFATVFVVPWLKYPPNPPAVGDPDTIDERTALYLVVLAWSVVATWAAWRLHRWLRARGAEDHVRATGTAAAWVAIVAIGFVALPGTPDEVTAPATLVWRFRLASLGGAAAFWAVFGATCGWLGHRAEAEAATSAARPSPATHPSPTADPR